MKKATCIIIEDDPAFQTILKSLVSKIPEIEILDIFDNSVDAALFITRKKPDLVFLDVEINGLSGLEVFDTLEKKPKTIVITGDRSYEAEASELEVDAFLTKPLPGFELLRSTIERVLES